VKKKFEILVHGADNVQYFPGCSAIFSNFDHVVTGCGTDASEAYRDAVEQIYMDLGEEANKLHLPKRPRGISKEDKAPPAEDWWYYISIRY
jgi:hypothetical protein